MTEEQKDAKIKKLEAALVEAWKREKALKAENDRLLSQEHAATVPLLSEYFDEPEQVEVAKSDSFVRLCVAGLAIIAVVTAFVLVIGGVF